MRAQPTNSPAALPHKNQAAATAAACNLVLDFSQLRGPLVQAGVLAALCPLVSSMLPELRLHALWALKNLTFGCEPQLQASLLQVG